jgi:hypothetical protein
MLAVLALAPPAVLRLQPGEPAAVLAPAAALAAVASPESGELSPPATLANYIAQQLDHQFLCGSETSKAGWVLDTRFALTSGIGQITGCPAGHRNAKESECLDAVEEAALKIRHNMEVGHLKVVNEGSEGVVPYGCSYSRASKNALFNSNASGRSSSLYELVCIEDHGTQESSDSLNQLRTLLRKAGENHPILRAGGDVSVLRPPPNATLLLYGTSHLRELRQILALAGQFGDYYEGTKTISSSNNCEEGRKVGGTGEQRRCGIRQGPCQLKSSDFSVDYFEGGAKVVMIANHRRYQIQHSQHEAALQKALEAHGPFTGGAFIKPHFKQYFDAQCRKDRFGTLPDPNEVGDLAESNCDMEDANCRDSDRLYQVVARHVDSKNLVYQADNLLKAARAEFHQLGLQDRISHLCSVTCADEQSGLCELGPGVAYAAKLMRMMTNA